MRHFSGTILGAALLALSLAGCADPTGEAGADSLADDFGLSTRNNTLIQSGQRDFAISLTRKFAAEVPNTVNFAFNAAVLDGTAQDALRRQAQWIRAFPQIRFRVYGHTDLVGSARYNQALGLRRARAVVAFLTSQGVAPAQLEAVVSLGKTQPLVYTPGPEPRNRRTVTEVIGLVRSTPAPIDGKYALEIYRGYLRSASATASNTVSNQTSAGDGASAGN